MKLNKEEITKIRNWLYNNGRDIDVARFNAVYDNEAKEDVLECLTMYQNKDGGFGNGLNHESMNPFSTFLTSSIALRYLIEAGFNKDTKNIFFQKMINNSFKYLYSNCKHEFWDTTDKRNDKYPGASYLKTPSKNSKYYPTCYILGETILLLNTNHPYYKIALKKIELIMKHYKNDILSERELRSFSFLLECLKKEKIDSIGAFSKFKNDLAIYSRDKRLILNNHLLDEDYHEEISKLIQNRLSIGVWDIIYSWDNSEEEVDIAQIKAISEQAVDLIILLKKYDSIE